MCCGICWSSELWPATSEYAVFRRITSRLEKRPKTHPCINQNRKDGAPKTILGVYVRASRLDRCRGSWLVIRHL
jgi:hypothetical protein